jgi:hypothetical protein
VKRAVLLVIACLTLPVVFGCAHKPPTSLPSSGPFEIPARRVSIPSLQFVAASDIARGASLKPGDKLVTGTYKPYLSGEHITSFQWITGSQGSQPFSAAMTLDASGTADLAKWSTANRGRGSVIVLGDTVIGVGPFARPVTDGQLYVSGPDFVGRRELIESAMVPIW